MHIKRAIAVNVIPPEADKSQALEQFEEVSRLVETYGGIVILKDNGVLIRLFGKPILQKPYCKESPLV